WPQNGWELIHAQTKRLCVHITHSNTGTTNPWNRRLGSRVMWAARHAGHRSSRQARLPWGEGRRKALQALAPVIRPRKDTAKRRDDPGGDIAHLPEPPRLCRRPSRIG